MNKIVIGVGIALAVALASIFFEKKLYNGGAEPDAASIDIPLAKRHSASDSIDVSSPAEGRSKDFSINLQDNGNRYTLSVDTHGVEAEDVDIVVMEGFLIITFKLSNKASQTLPSDTHFDYLSRYMGQFRKRVALPGPVAADKISYELKNGILAVTLPKA